MIFPLRPEKLTLIYKSCIFPILNDDSAANCPALKMYPFSSFFIFVLFCSSIGTKFGIKRPPPHPPPREFRVTIECPNVLDFYT